MYSELSEIKMLKWLRPSTVKFPIIWRTFKGNKGQKQYWIQDVTKAYRSQLLKFGLDSFLRDEPLTNSVGESHYRRVIKFRSNRFTLIVLFLS